MSRVARTNPLVRELDAQIGASAMPKWQHLTIRLATDFPKGTLRGQPHSVLPKLNSVALV